MEIVVEKYVRQLLQSKTFERWVLALRENPSRLLHFDACEMQARGINGM
jgi:hypothetical protein